MEIYIGQDFFGYKVVDICPWPDGYPPEGGDLKSWYSYRDYLNKRGIPVKEVKDGFRITLFREVDPDAIILDVLRRQISLKKVEDLVMGEINFRKSWKGKECPLLPL